MTNTFADLMSTWPSTRAELADWLKEAIGSVRATKIDEPAFHSVQLVHRAYRHLLDLGAPASTLNAVMLLVPGDPVRAYLGNLVRGGSEWYRGFPDTLARLHAAHEWAAATPTPPPPAGWKPSEKIGKKTKGKNIQPRMLKLWQEQQHEVVNWSAVKWAEQLGCAESTVRGTKLWKTDMKKFRLAERLGRAEHKEKHRLKPRRKG